MKITMGSVSLRFEYGNPEWAAIMEGGQGDQEVTGVVNLPQGGTRASKAVAIGGTAFNTSEPATGIITEAEQMCETSFQQLVSDILSEGDLETAPEKIKAAEFFFTNLLKTRLQVYLSECENQDEVAGTMMVIEGTRAIIDVNFNINNVEEAIAKEITSAIGGGS